MKTSELLHFQTGHMRKLFESFPEILLVDNFGFQLLYVLECNELAKFVLNHFLQVLVWTKV